MPVDNDAAGTGPLVADLAVAAQPQQLIIHWA